MEIHTCLWNEVSAFDFSAADLAPIQEMPGVSLVNHRSAADFLSVAEQAEILLTWDFPVPWYEACTSLKTIMTPAAGQDWVEADPTGKVQVIHGTFHGEILAESLLSAILYMNHRMSAMQKNFSERAWDRNLQQDCRLLKDQQVLIVGFGNIGQSCGRLISRMGAYVTGVSRTPKNLDYPASSVTVEELDHVLPLADHVVLLLPGDHSTDAFMDAHRLAMMKPGAVLYNFGRGNAIRHEDLVAAWDSIGGAFLDVTEEEPLPADSPLWTLPNMMITPHSSCVYVNYRPCFIAEARRHIETMLQ